MQLSLYGICVLTLVLTLQLTTTVSLPDQLTLALGQHKFIEHHEPEDPSSNLLTSDDNDDRTKSDISLHTSDKSQVRPTRSTKIDKKRKMLLKAIRHILENKTRTHNDIQLDTMTQRDLDTVAVSDLVKLVLSTKHRFKRHADKINRRIDEVKHGRDIVLEAVKLLIEDEKTRRHFDMVNPPNSQYSKLQQLLWDRLRIKAAEELILHPISFPGRVTERIFDSLKLDLEMQTTEPTSEAALFSDFKRRIQKQYYLDEYGVRGREFVSTLKPRVIYSK